MSVVLYVLGYIVVIAGVAYLARLLHIPQAWIIGIVLLMVGGGLVTASRVNGPRT